MVVNKLNAIEELKKEIKSEKEKSDLSINKIKEDTFNNVSEMCREQIKSLMNESRVSSTEIDNSIDILQSNIDNLTVEIRSLEIHIKRSEELNIHIATGKSRIISINNDILTIRSKLFDDTSIILEEAELEKINSNIKKLKYDIDTLEELAQDVSFWKEGFSDRGIPSMMIDSSIPYLNRSISEELEIVAPGKFTVSFDTRSQTKSGDLREKFSVSVLNNYTGADEHRLLSGGEKRQIDVCCMMSLRKLSEIIYQKTFNVLFLDEVLDSLDEDNASLFCRYIKLLSSNLSVTLITHSISQDAECDRILPM